MTGRWKIEFTRGKLSPGVPDGVRCSDGKLRPVDGFYNFESPCMSCHGEQSGPMNSSQIIELTKEVLERWLKKGGHLKEVPLTGREGWKPGMVKHPPITGKSLYFRCDFPKILKREDVFRMLAELKGAKRDKLGGLWA